MFEERTQPKPHSRANNVWTRGQELLHGIGVRDALAAQSYRIEKQTAFLDGKPLDQVPLDEVKSPFPQVLYSGQDVIEKTLGEQAAAKGALVERGRKVTSIDQDAGGVTVIVATVDDEGKKTGASETLRCRYVVGADGDKGFVRKSVGLDFPLDKLTGRATWQIDAKLTWQRSTQADQIWFFVYHHGLASVLPVWQGYHRMFFLEDEERMPDREPTLEEMQAHAREITGDGTLTFTDPTIWLSHSKFQHGHADAYAKGRVFLAGDAGHSERAGEAVELPHDQRVACTQDVFQNARQFGPVITCARCLFGEHLVAAGAAQRIELKLGLLIAGADPGIAYPHARPIFSNPCAAYLGRASLENSRTRRACRDVERGTGLV